MQKVTIKSGLIYWSKALFVGVILGFSVQFAVAWVEPVSAPPSGNVDAPLNTGDAGQSKSGGPLWLNKANVSTVGLISEGDTGFFNGNIGIGTMVNPPESDTSINMYAPKWPTIYFDNDLAPKSVSIYLANKSTTMLRFGRYVDNFGALEEKVFSFDMDNGRLGIKKLNPSYELDVNGTIRVGGTVYNSDRKLKNNIKPLDNYNDILNVEPSRFTWKENRKDDIGIIAQDVEKYFPEFVSEKNDIKSIDYPKIVVPLLGVVQAQQKQIENLTKRIETLENN